MGQIALAKDLRPGRIIVYENGMFEVMKYDFVTQGRGGWSVKLVLKNIKTKAQLPLSVNAEVKFMIVEVLREVFEYMYDDGETIFSVDGAEFPIYKVRHEHNELIKEAGAFEVVKLDDEIYDITLPQKAKVKIAATEPYIKGQTAKASYKPAQLSNGWTIQVPPFIEEGEIIIVDASDLDNLMYESKAEI